MIARRSKVVLAGAFVTVATGLISAANAATFADNFQTGGTYFTYGANFNSDTTTNYWTGYYYLQSTAPAVLTEPVGGPLTMGFASSAKTTDGSYMYGQESNEFNFFSSPLTLTDTAASGSNLLPGTDYTDSNAAYNYMGVEASSGYFRIGDNGSNKAVLQLSNQNALHFYIENGSSQIFYQFTYTPIAAASNIDVLSTFIYLDGTNEANGHLYLNFGETYEDTSTGIVTTSTFEQNRSITTPFDIGIQPLETQTQLNASASAFSNDTGLGLEVLNESNNANGNVAVAFGSITDIPTAVPEPGSLALLTVGMGLLCRRGSRREQI